MFLQSGTHPVGVKICRRGGREKEKMMMEAILKDVWILDDGSSLDLLRINTGHTNNNNNNNTAVTTEDGGGGDDFQNKQQDYFETVFGHRGDRRADWAGIYTQLTEEHSERYVPNRWDYTTTAELVRLNLKTLLLLPLQQLPPQRSPLLLHRPRAAIQGCHPPPLPICTAP